MGDDEALLAAIRDKPDDDAPRLIYADFLEEHGQDLRAKWIRRQIEVARKPNGRDIAKCNVAGVRFKSGIRLCGFYKVLEIKPWLWFSPEQIEKHVHPMYVISSYNSYRISVTWYRGFPVAIGCGPLNLREFHDRFNYGPKVICFLYQTYRRLNLFDWPNVEEFSRNCGYNRLRWLLIDH